MRNYIVWHISSITRRRRVYQNGHKSVALWFTGLSGSGKSTLANAVERQLHRFDCNTFALDGDNVRHDLCSDLGFSAANRSENIRRIAEVGKFFVDAGMIVMAAFISPFRKDREIARKILDMNFLKYTAVVPWACVRSVMLKECMIRRVVLLEKTTIRRC